MFTEKVDLVEEGLTWLLDAARSGELPVARLKDLITASRSWEAKVSALQTDSARLISARERHGDGGASVLRDQAGKSKFQARRSLGAAEALDEMPGLRGAVDSGEVSLANAERLADAARRTNPEAVDAAGDLVAMAKELPPDRFAREAAAWTQRHQTDHGHDDWLDKRRRRYLKTWKQQDGMVRLDGLLDPETGTRICSRLEGVAEALHRQDQQSARAGNDPGRDEGGRSWDQLRADALDRLTSGGADNPKGRGDSGGRPKAEVIVVADIGVLTGEDPAGRCEIPGTGPVPPGGARAHRLRRPPHRGPVCRRQAAASRFHGAHGHRRPVEDAHRQRPRLHRLRRRTQPLPSPPHRALRPVPANRHREPRARLLVLPPQHPRPPLASRPPQRQTSPRTPRPPGPAQPRQRRATPQPQRPRSPPSTPNPRPAVVQSSSTVLTLVLVTRLMNGPVASYSASIRRHCVMRTSNCPHTVFASPPDRTTSRAALS